MQQVHRRPGHHAGHRQVPSGPVDQALARKIAMCDLESVGGFFDLGESLETHMAGKGKEAVEVVKARKALFSQPEVFDRNLEKPGVRKTVGEAAMESGRVICGADSSQSALRQEAPPVQELQEPALTGQ